MPEYDASKLMGIRVDAYFPSFSGTGNSRPQCGQITVSPGFHSFVVFFVEAHEVRRNRAQRSRSNGLANRLIGGVSLRRSSLEAVSYTHLRAHETRHDLVCRLLL